MKSGQCLDCPEFERSDGELNYECQPNECHDRQKLLKDGTCEDCGPYTRSDGLLNKVC